MTLSTGDYRRLETVTSTTASPPPPPPLLLTATAKTLPARRHLLLLLLLAERSGAPRFSIKTRLHVCQPETQDGEGPTDSYSALLNDIIEMLIRGCMHVQRQ